MLSSGSAPARSRAPAIRAARALSLSREGSGAGLAGASGAKLCLARCGYGRGVTVVPRPLVSSAPTGIGLNN
jgi:hypothetical protein